MSETILLVEDEHVVRTLAKAVLERQGYRVIEAANGAEALERGAGAIDLLLTDKIMPGMGGLELIRRFSPAHPETRILLMSGEPDPAAGVPHLEKPFPRALIGRVKQALAG